jgi:hypothetical protein
LIVMLVPVLSPSGSWLALGAYASDPLTPETVNVTLVLLVPMRPLATLHCPLLPVVQEAFSA